MIGIVIVAHGGLAREYLAAMQHVVGPQPGLAAISIEAVHDRDAPIPFGTEFLGNLITVAEKAQIPPERDQVPSHGLAAVENSAEDDKASTVLQGHR